MLNDVTFVEAARGFAERLVTGPDRSPEARMTTAFHLATGRRPRPEELRILVEGFHDQLARFGRDPRLAEALIATGESSAIRGSTRSSWRLTPPWPS